MNRSTDRAATASLYRLAAQYIERESNAPSCSVVAYLKDIGMCTMDVPEARRYADIFAPEMVGENGYGRMVYQLPAEEVRDYRVLALCFAAAMVEAGDA